MIERELLMDLRAEIMKIAREEVKKAILDTSTVRRGRWIRDEFGSRCECCGMYAYRDKSDRPWESYYCPNCGADMRG